MKAQYTLVIPRVARDDLTKRPAMPQLVARIDLWPIALSLRCAGILRNLKMTVYWIALGGRRVRPYDFSLVGVDSMSTHQANPASRSGADPENR